MLVNGLVTLLRNDGTVSGFVNDRILPIPAPEDLSQYPCVTYQVASDLPGYTLTNSDGVTTSRVVFNCYGLRYGDAYSLARAVKAVLSSYQGMLPGGGPQVYESQIVNLVDGFDDGSRISRTTVHAVLQYAD